MNQKPTSFVLGALGCLPVLVFAVTPTITSVSGTVQQGQTLSIMGTSMVQEDRTNWDPLFVNNPNASGFEGTDPNADGYVSTNGATYVTDVKLMGSQSILMYSKGAATWPTNINQMWYWNIDAGKPGTSWTDVYLRAYSRWRNDTGIWPNEIYKYWWFGTTTTHFAYFNLAANSDYSAPNQFCAISSFGGGDWGCGDIPGGALKTGQWYLIEFHFRIFGAGNYVMEVWVDNTQIVNKTTNVDGVTGDSQGGWETDTNHYNTTAAHEMWHWQDGFAVSKTRVGPASLIEISNCSTYGSGAKRYQAPEFLSDVSSQIKVDLAGLGAGPYVLWVTNNRNERSLPFLMGTGTPSCAQSALSAPGNLRVQ